jgi:integrase/recombinase XerD
MNDYQLDDPTLVDRYLHQLSGVQPANKARYGAVLRQFQVFVNGAPGESILSLETLRQWLQNRRAVWPLDTLIHRLRIVDRFLDWLALSQQLPGHPLAVLRETYGRHNRGAMVRALLSAEPQQALEQLRPWPRFASHLGPAMQVHLTRMRTLGYRYEREEYHLLRFDRYLQTRTDASAQPLDVLVGEWAALAANPILTQQRLGMGRALARSLHRTDATVADIPLDRSLVRAATHQQRSPYIYSEDDIRDLLTTARQWASPCAPLRPLTLEAMLTLAYGAGLRLGELVRLTRGDLDLQHATIEIRQTKFFKLRRLPLAATIMTTLQRYVAARRQVGASEAADAALFWNEQKRQGYALVTAEHLLT